MPTLSQITSTMNVSKRDGRQQKISFDKITSRIEKLCFGLDYDILNPISLAQTVVRDIYPGIKTSEIDALTAETAAARATQSQDFSILASRIAISNLHKQTSKKFSDVIHELYTYEHHKTGKVSPIIQGDIYEFVMANAERLNAEVIHDRDFSNYDFFGFKTIEKSYLLKVNGRIIERPQHLLMRVAVSINYPDMDNVISTYDALSKKKYIHATPTLYNSGINNGQYASCFLTGMDDSIDGIFHTVTNCAKISKHSGGIGCNLSDIRANGSYIAGVNGTSSGIVPLMRTLNATALYVNQGSRRKGSIAIYLEPWHADIFEFLDMKKNTGNEMERARDLFYALWVPNKFMERVEKNESWSIFCPDEAPGLSDVYGSQFDELYDKYEKDGLARKVVNARDIWNKIIDSQVETGTPYILYKDHINEKSNQKNVGVIKCSNLCAEITEYTSSDEVAVCNLCSLSLPNFVSSEGEYDFNGLEEIASLATRNLNQVIDRTFYPIEEAKNSNLKHRPIGVGVQGLADVFALMRIPFESEEAKVLNRNIFETIYYGCVKASVELAKVHGPYETFKGSPASQGLLQFDLWGEKVDNSRHDWISLKKDVVQYGLRNSLLVALPPTASTSSILGNNECFEPFTSNIYNRRVLSGEFSMVNKHMLKDLTSLGLWNSDIRNKIIRDGGSIQNIHEIPVDVRNLYKTVWEIKQKAMIDLAIGRSPFVCQSQSMNLFMSDPSVSKLSSAHFYTWKSGLKTGIYYLRSTGKSNAVQFTVSNDSKVEVKEEEGCESCSA